MPGASLKWAARAPFFLFSRDCPKWRNHQHWTVDATFHDERDILGDRAELVREIRIGLSVGPDAAVSLRAR